MGPLDCQGYVYMSIDPLAVFKPKIMTKFIPEKIIYNGPATIVFWDDGTKTVVKMAEGTNYSKYNAFCAALAKKIIGSNSAVNRIVASGIEQK